MSKWLTVTEGEGPIVAVAVHDGHELRPEVAELTALSDSDRLRMVASTRVVSSRSRFEVDLNRPRDKAVYLRPEDAWGLGVWRGH